MKNDFQIVDVLNAVRSLYEDELRPVGRLLRKRTAEFAASREHWELVLRGAAKKVSCEEAREVDGEALLGMCEACEQLQVLREVGNDWCVLVVGWPPRFVDIYSRYDAYPAAMWEAFSAYCESSEAQDLTLPGGRYICAKALKARSLPFFAGFSLGRISHIVQLALTDKKILGYYNQSVVPYNRSQSMRKEHCAKAQQPCPGNVPMTLANFETTRACLREILDTSPSGELPLSNVKRLFRSRFHLELSETSFGYSKISEFLQDSRLRDICTVQLRGRGYIVSKAGASQAQVINLSEQLQPLPAAAANAAAETAASEAVVEQTKASGELWRRRPGFQLKSQLAGAEEEEEEELNVVAASQPREEAFAGKFAGTVPTSASPVRSDTSTRANSSCEDFASKYSSSATTSRNPSPAVGRQTRQHVRSRTLCLAEDFQEALLTPSRLTPGRLRQRGIVVQNTFLHFAAPLPTPLGARFRSSSSPPLGKCSEP